jgi:pimeloyl-ACP methyl ester carboxylesterase
MVGHSFGGVVITQAAEERPAKVALLVYLAAALLRNGESLLQVVREDGQSQVLPNLVVAADRSAATIREEAYKDLFGADCPDRGRSATSPRLHSA